jgi:hypothetical protein
MGRERKSPQEKKHHEYTKDHFTFGWNSSRMFPRTWKRKKAQANREYRRKSDALIIQTKAGVAADDVELIADDLTVARFQKSLVRKRLSKTGTVTVGEKVKRNLERREEAFGRRVKNRRRDDQMAALAVKTLNSVDHQQLVDVARRADRLCGDRNARELKRVLTSKDAVDRALYFLFRVCAGSVFELDALRRNPNLANTLDSWMRKANRISKNDKRAEQRKIQQKRAARERLKAWRGR